MYKHILKNKLLLMLVVIIMVVSVISQDAYAWGGRGGWHGGRWYGNGWFWFGAAATALTLGAIVGSLPPYYNTVYYGGVPYYYYDGIYYRPYSNGYMVVQAPSVTTAPVMVQQPYTTVAQPVMTQQPYAASQPVMAAPVESANTIQTVSPATTQGEPFTVNVPNSKSGWTSVTLTRSGTGFIGPQGEYYQEFPKVKQLKEMYGK